MTSSSPGPAGSGWRPARKRVAFTNKKMPFSFTLTSLVTSFFNLFTFRKSLSLVFCILHLISSHAVLTSEVSSSSTTSLTSYPSCNPIICFCSDRDLSADCSNKGFLVTPNGLPDVLLDLNLSGNDLQEVNATVILRLQDLRSLDLSGNKLISFFLRAHYKLEKLNLASNNISSVRALNLKGLLALKGNNINGLTQMEKLLLILYSCFRTQLIQQQNHISTSQDVSRIRFAPKSKLEE